MVTLFVTSFLHSQDNNPNKEVIPDSLIGTWMIDAPGQFLEGQGEVPSQIFKWKFSKMEAKKGAGEFHWLFKRQEDKDFITVFVAVYDFYIEEGKIHGNMVKGGSQQKEAMVMEFYDEIKWSYPGDERFKKFGNKKIKPAFEINSDFLFLLEDHNGDGDFEDEGERQKYTKENQLKI